MHRRRRVGAAHGDAERLLGLGEAPEQIEGDAAVVEDRGAAGRERPRAVEELERFARQPLVLEHDREIAEVVPALGLERDRALEHRNRLARPAEAVEADPPIAQRLWMVRVLGERDVGEREGRRIVLTQHQDGGECRRRARVSGPHLEGPPQERLGLGRAALLEMEPTQARQRLRIVGFQGERPLERPARRIRPAGFVQDTAENRVRARMIGQNRRRVRRGDQRIVEARLRAERTDPVDERIDVIGNEAETGGIGLVGFRRPPDREKRAAEIV